MNQILIYYGCSKIFELCRILKYQLAVFCFDFSLHSGGLASSRVVDRGDGLQIRGGGEVAVNKLNK
jgi:hypothetical protein